MATKPVAIIMGSQSDWVTMKHAAETLKALKIAHESLIVSRTPHAGPAFRIRPQRAQERLQGGDRRRRRRRAPAGHDRVDDAFARVRRADEQRSARGQGFALLYHADAGWHPVGTLAIGKPGAINRALLAAGVLALADPKIAKRLDAWAPRQTKAVSKPKTRILLKPGATIGILGGGQLGRMLRSRRRGSAALPHLRAGKGFLRLPGTPLSTCAPYEDERALMRFAAAVDVITYEFENVPAKTAALLAKRKKFPPDPKVLEITQDRLIEKNFISELGIATAPYGSVHSASQLSAAIEKVGCPRYSRRGSSATTARARRKSPKAATRRWRGAPWPTCPAFSKASSTSSVSVDGRRARERRQRRMFRRHRTSTATTS